LEATADEATLADVDVFCMMNFIPWR